MSYQDFGFTQAARQVQQSLSKFVLRNYLKFFLRFSGFFLLGLIAYLHFIFDSINPRHSEIILWMSLYLVYLGILEVFYYKKISFYNERWFILIRISCNLLFVSWLLYAAPLMRGILIFAYLIPIIASIFYFPQNFKTPLLIYFFSVFGVVFSSIVFDFQTPLMVWQVLIAAGVMGMLFIGLRQSYLKELLRLPLGISEITKKLQGSLDLTDIVEQISEGVLLITDAEGIFILIVDPEDQSYTTDKVFGLNLSPSFEMDELIHQCSAIQKGQPYGHDDLNESEDKDYFSQFFVPPPRSIMIEPIFNSKRKVLGLILVGSFHRAQFGDRTKAYLQQFCASAALALEANLIYRKARLSLLGRKNAAEQLLEVDDETEIVRVLVEQASTLIGNADGCVFHRYEKDLDCLIAKGGVKSSELGKLIPWAASYTDSKNLGSTVMHVGQGFAGHALSKGKIIVSDDVKKHPWFIKSAQQEKITSLMSAPLFDPNTQLPLGTLSVHSKQRSAFTIEDQSTLIYLSKQGAVCIARVQESEEWRVRGGILKAIFESALEIDFDVSENVVSQQIADIAQRILPFGMVRIRLYDPVTMELVSVAAAGYPKGEQESLIGTRLPIIELEKFLKLDYAAERSFLIPSNAAGWKEFAKKYLYIPTEINTEGSWDRFDAFFTPLISETGDLLGYISWDQPEDTHRPKKRIIEAVGAFASMAGWSLDLTRAYSRIHEQRGLITHFIASTTEKLKTVRGNNLIGEVAIDIGRERLNSEACSLYMVYGNEIELTNSTYLKNTKYMNKRKPIVAEAGCGLSSWVAATKIPLYFNSIADYMNHPAWTGNTEHLDFLPSKKCQNLLLVPLTDNTGECLGVLSFENKLGKVKTINFSDYDIQIAMNIAEELWLSLGLAEQINNARAVDEYMLEDDLHELKNQFYYGIQTASDLALFWLRSKKYQRAERYLEKIELNSLTLLDELYNLHNSVKRKYYEIEDFREALELLVDSFLHTFVGHEDSFEDKKARVEIVCSSNIDLTPLLRYTFLRIVSGALMNSIKHSGFLESSNVSITISVDQDDGHIKLRVKDNGRGDQHLKPGYGIGRMHDLVRFLKKENFDVRLFIDSDEEIGTIVELIAELVPLEV